MVIATVTTARAFYKTVMTTAQMGLATGLETTFATPEAWGRTSTVRPTSLTRVTAALTMAMMTTNYMTKTAEFTTALACAPMKRWQWVGLGTELVMTAHTVFISTVLRLSSTATIAQMIRTWSNRVARAAASQTFCLVWSSSAQPRPWKQITARVREESDMADTESFVMSTFFCNEDLSTPTIDEGNQDFDLEWEAGGTCIDDCDLTAYEACNPAFLTLSCLSDCDDQYVTEITEYISGGCIFAEYIGDGWCDADHFHNNAAQNFDGGDCCPETCVDSTFECGVAGFHCIDPEQSDLPNCLVQFPGYVNDGYCDHGGPYNTKACNYDGGDCCASSCAGDLCGVVGFDCKDEDYVELEEEAVEQNTVLDCDGADALGFTVWIGDGSCDDGAYGVNFNCEGEPAC